MLELVAHDCCSGSVFVSLDMLQAAAGSRWKLLLAYIITPADKRTDQQLKMVQGHNASDRAKALVQQAVQAWDAVLEEMPEDLRDFLWCGLRLVPSGVELLLAGNRQAELASRLMAQKLLEHSFLTG